MPNCYSKGGAKEGQGPRQKNVKKMETVVITTDDNEGDLFAFTCMLDHTAIAWNLDIPKSKHGTCIDSRASKDYCPDRSKFSNYKSIQRKITTADGRFLSAIGMGDLYIELPNGSDKTKVISKNAIHTPEMAFTLISISRLDKVSYSIIFTKGMCTIKGPTSQTIATIPNSDGLYKIASLRATDTKNTANIASGKMSLS